jgi:hypothetical protein
MLLMCTLVLCSISDGEVSCLAKHHMAVQYFKVLCLFSVQGRILSVDWHWTLTSLIHDIIYSSVWFLIQKIGYLCFFIKF